MGRQSMHRHHRPIGPSAGANLRPKAGMGTAAWACHRHRQHDRHQKGIAMRAGSISIQRVGWGGVHGVGGAGGRRRHGPPWMRLAPGPLCVFVRNASPATSARGWGWGQRGQRRGTAGGTAAWSAPRGRDSVATATTRGSQGWQPGRGSQGWQPRANKRGAPNSGVLIIGRSVSITVDTLQPRYSALWSPLGRWADVRAAPQTGADNTRDAHACPRLPTPRPALAKRGGAAVAQPNNALNLAADDKHYIGIGLWQAGEGGAKGSRGALDALQATSPYTHEDPLLFYPTYPFPPLPHAFLFNIPMRPPAVVVRYRWRTEKASNLCQDLRRRCGAVRGR